MPEPDLFRHSRTDDLLRKTAVRMRTFLTAAELEALWLSLKVAAVAVLAAIPFAFA
jgi:hypothetical protein